MRARCFWAVSVPCAMLCGVVLPTGMVPPGGPPSSHLFRCSHLLLLFAPGGVLLVHPDQLWRHGASWSPHLWQAWRLPHLATASRLVPIYPPARAPLRSSADARLQWELIKKLHSLGLACLPEVPGSHDTISLTSYGRGARSLCLVPAGGRRSAAGNLTIRSVVTPVSPPGHSRYPLYHTNIMTM